MTVNKNNCPLHRCILTDCTPTYYLPHPAVLLLPGVLIQFSLPRQLVNHDMGAPPPTHLDRGTVEEQSTIRGEVGGWGGDEEIVMPPSSRGRQCAVYLYRYAAGGEWTEPINTCMHGVLMGGQNGGSIKRETSGSVALLTIFRIVY